MCNLVGTSWILTFKSIDWGTWHHFGCHDFFNELVTSTWKPEHTSHQENLNIKCIKIEKMKMLKYLKISQNDK
jgi:hypothetical protein